MRIALLNHVMTCSLLAFTGCASQDLSKIIPEYVGKCTCISIPKGATVAEIIDGYGVSAPIPGGLSDGYIFARLLLSEDESKEFLVQLAQSAALDTESSWKSLPLAENVAQGKNFLKVPGAAWHADPSKPLPLDLRKGYYAFVDKQLVKPDRHTGEPWNDRPSVDFVFAIYDEDNRELYFLELDT